LLEQPAASDQLKQLDDELRRRCNFDLKFFHRPGRGVD
jgi:hypothetical protein